ncbi:hypothetical protein M0R45_005033 [Rubus argutus]|uniref:Secreted protein n=1 Tax=Rubus argutus TaxID=59490 RepID=A0AAW1YLC4_RUBAR
MTAIQSAQPPCLAAAVAVANLPTAVAISRTHRLKFLPPSMLLDPVIPAASLIHRRRRAGRPTREKTQLKLP